MELYEHTQYLGGVWRTDVVSLVDCLSVCLRDQACVTVDTAEQHCYLHYKDDLSDDSMRERVTANGITQLALRRGFCDGT